MTSIAYCVLSPKPFHYCQVCARNPVHAQYGWRMKFKSPIVNQHCKDFIALREVKTNESK